MKRLGDFITYIFLIVCMQLLQAEVQVNFDEHLSDDAKQCIYQCIDEKQLHEKKLPQSAQLMQKCPAIKDVSIARSAPEDVEITIASSTPHARVNEIYVLTKDGQILDSSLYKNVDHLPVVQTRNSDSDLTTLCKKFLLALPHELLREYDVEWKNGTNILLHDKEQPFFTVTCRASAPLDALQHEACKKIKKELVARGQLGDEPIEAWNADMRFDKQIILSRK